MPTEDEDEVLKLKSEVENVLQELSNLEVQFEDILKPKLRQDVQGAVDTNYLVAVRRFQNGMRVSLLNGAETGNKQTFEKGFEFYVGALTILKANSDIGEIQQLNNELIQTLFKIITKSNPSANESDPYGPFYIQRSCQQLATIYELSDEFELAMKFRDRASNFLKGLKRELELIKKLIDALLSKKISVVQETLQFFEIKHIRRMGTLFFQGFTKNDLQKIQTGKNLLETLAAQRNLSIIQTLSLIQKLIFVIKQKTRDKTEPEQIIQVSAPSQSIHLSDNIINDLRNVLKEGIQQLKSVRSEISQETPVIDTSTIISEIKNVISEEIKTVSSEIVSQILNKLPVRLPSAPRAHSSGNISDDVPDIKIVGPASGERQPRPKLDDMLDSIIVSE